MDTVCIVARKVCCWFSIMTLLTPPTVWRSHVPLAALTQTCSSLCSCRAFLQHRPVALEPIQWSPPRLHGGDSLWYDGDPGLFADLGIEGRIDIQFMRQRQSHYRVRAPAKRFLERVMAIQWAMTSFDGFSMYVLPPHDESPSSYNEDSAPYGSSIED